jgi:hypothetical protein
MEAAPTPATAETAPPITPAERRRFERVSVSFFGTVRLAAGGVCECLVIDLSRGGAKIVLGEALPIASADALALEIEKFGVFRAEAVWRRGTFLGIRFCEPPETVGAAFRNFLPPAN